MKTTCIITACLLAATGLNAQDSAKKTTVHQKSVTIVDGVRTETDTAYTTGVPELNITGPGIKVSENMIVSDDKLAGDKTIPKDFIINKSFINDSIDLTGKTMRLRKAPCGTSVEDLKNAEEINIYIVKKIGITDPTEEEKKSVSGNFKTDDKLALSNMNFYPNPNNGKFSLAFNLSDKGDTDISIFNAEGKVVYNEKLPSFSGKYDKEIDISKNNKGIYFVKIMQGKHAQMKKIVME